MASETQRVRVGDDEIGIYVDKDWVKLIHFDHQGDCVIEFPMTIAGALGEALQGLQGFVVPGPLPEPPPPPKPTITEDFGQCPTCHKWPLYRGRWDRHGNTMRCHGCLRIPGECTCG